jgi:hypothetical protein
LLSDNHGTAQVLREMIGLSTEEFSAKLALGERAIEMEFEAHGSEAMEWRL